MSNAQYIESKLDNKVYCKTNGQFTRHLKHNNLTYQEYYETYVTGITPLCYCNRPLSFYQKNESYAKSCGMDECIGKSISKAKQSWDYEQRLEDSKNKKLAALNRTSEQIKAQLEASQITCMERYGVLWVSQTNIQKEKSKKTKLEKYGNINYNNSEVSRSKNKNKSTTEKNKINQLRRETNLKRYGVENIFLIPGK